MKTYFYIVSMLLGFVILFAACNKDEKHADSTTLPLLVNTFLSDHFADAKILTISKENDFLSGTEYKISLNNGIQIDFDKIGNWEKVKTETAKGNIPTSFILPMIVSYIQTNYPSFFIKSIEREKSTFEVELSNDVELTFDKEGNFLTIEEGDTNIVLPLRATVFLNTHFEKDKVLTLKGEHEGLLGLEYKLILSNGVKLKFDSNGDWIEVEQQGKGITGIPTSFILANIIDYISKNYPTTFINSINKEQYSFEVELSNGLELSFDRNGDFVRIDP